jgi:hypothetical protein
VGAQLKANSGQLQAAETNLANLNNELKLDLAQAAADAAGILDPTPISDLVGAGISVARGDWVGAGLSLVSMIPYAGDAIGKTAKGAKLVKKINDLRKRIEAAIASVNLFKKLARQRAAAAVRAKRKAEAAKKAAESCVSKNCKPPTNRFGTRLPADDKGTWSGEKGNSIWTPKDGGAPVQYKDGYPDFSPYSKGDVEIDMDLGGNRTKDFDAADAAMRERLGDPNWKKPDDLVWHHKEDGTTMQLVPKDVHGPAQHTGGVSVVTDPEY